MPLVNKPYQKLSEDFCGIKINEFIFDDVPRLETKNRRKQYREIGALLMTFETLSLIGNAPFSISMVIFSPL